MTDEYDPQTEMQAIDKQVGGWFDAFAGSPEHQQLTEIQKDKAPGIIRFLTEYSFRYIGASPEGWNRSVLAECCTEILPKKMSAAVAVLDAEIVAASQDERNWGPAKAFMMAAERAGVDRCDQGATARGWLRQLIALHFCELKQKATTVFEEVCSDRLEIEQTGEKPGTNAQ